MMEEIKDTGGNNDTPATTIVSNVTTITGNGTNITQITSQTLDNFEPDPKWEMTTLEKASFEPTPQEQDEGNAFESCVLSQSPMDTQMEKVIDDIVELERCQQYNQPAENDQSTVAVQEGEVHRDAGVVDSDITFEAPVSKLVDNDQQREPTSEVIEKTISPPIAVSKESVQPSTQDLNKLEDDGSILELQSGPQSSDHQNLPQPEIEIDTKTETCQLNTVIATNVMDSLEDRSKKDDAQEDIKEEVIVRTETIHNADLTEPQENTDNQVANSLVTSNSNLDEPLSKDEDENFDSVVLTSTDLQNDLNDDKKEDGVVEERLVGEKLVEATNSSNMAILDHEESNKVCTNEEPMEVDDTKSESVKPTDNLKGFETLVSPPDDSHIMKVVGSTSAEGHKSDIVEEVVQDMNAELEDEVDHDNSKPEKSGKNIPGESELKQNEPKKDEPSVPISEEQKVEEQEDTAAKLDVDKEPKKEKVFRSRRLHERADREDVEKKDENSDLPVDTDSRVERRRSSRIKVEVKPKEKKPKEVVRKEVEEEKPVSSSENKVECSETNKELSPQKIEDEAKLERPVRSGRQRLSKPPPPPAPSPKPIDSAKKELARRPIKRSLAKELEQEDFSPKMSKPSRQPASRMTIASLNKPNKEQPRRASDVDKDYKCTHCNYATSRMDNLILHMRQFCEPLQSLWKEKCLRYRMELQNSPKSNKKRSFR